MGISLLLETGSSALTAQRMALEVTGENITNVNTPGYSRQTAGMVPGVSTIVNGVTIGGGVQVDQITRSYDSFLQGELVSGNSANGQATTSNSAMQLVQPLFNDLTTSGLGSSLQGFFSAWQDLSANPQGVPERQTVLTKGQELVDDFHRISGSLAGVKNNMNDSMVGWASDVNNGLKQVASLNARIKQVEAIGGQANEMRDQRELLVRNLAQKVGITATEQSDGTLKVSLPYPSGQTLVAENNAATFSLQRDASNRENYDVMLAPVGGGALLDTTAFIGGTGNTQGSIGAMLQMRDTVVTGYQSRLDELATTLTSQVNQIHENGYGMSDNQHGISFFTPTTTAAGMALNPTVAGDASYIAAADQAPSTGGTGNNVNAQSIAAIYDQSFALTGGAATLGDFYTGLVGKVGVDVQNADRADTQTTATLNQLNNLRESESGVSLDEELTNLNKYQMAYQGAAKLITVGTQMLDTVLGLIQ